MISMTVMTEENFWGQKKKHKMLQKAVIIWTFELSASLVSFSSSLDPPCKTILSTEEEISTRLLKLPVPANIFSVLPHSRRLKSLQIFRFDILNLKLFDFQTAKGMENI